MIIPFLRERPASLLLLLRDTNKEWYVSNLSRKSGLTYPHTTAVLKHYLNLGIVEYSASGRKKIVKLTEKGKQISSSLNDILDMLNEE
jgi:predicted transcriptional regulator